MSERTDVLVISDTFGYVNTKQMETILMQMKKSICMIKENQQELDSFVVQIMRIKIFHV